MYEALASLPGRIEIPYPRPLRPQESRTVHDNQDSQPSLSPLGSNLSGYNFVLDHITGSKNPADGPSRRPDYAENVELPSGALIPQSTLRLLPSSAGPAPGNLPSSSFASAEASLSSSGTCRLASNTPIPANITVFPIESSLCQRILDA